MSANKGRGTTCGKASVGQMVYTPYLNVCADHSAGVGPVQERSDLGPCERRRVTTPAKRQS